MKHYGWFYVIVLILVITACILVFSRENVSDGELRQTEIIWNNIKELELLCKVENNIERARNGVSLVAAVSSSSSRYETICPKMLAPEENETEITTNTTPEKMTVYLTFDDGPSRQTLKVLDILEQYGINATFFIISDNISETGIEALKLAALRGHVIGMHADSHNYSKMYQSVESFLMDYETVYNLIQKETGTIPTLYRFPGGSYNSVGRTVIKSIIPEMERRGFVYYDWNVTAEDAVGTPTASSIKRNIFKNLENTIQPVILMHDGASNSLTVAVLPEIIEELVRRGYSFDTLDHREPCQFSW